MSTDPSLWGYVANAGIVVKFVMLLLLIASVATWTIIFQRYGFLKRAKRAAMNFEDEFWAGTDLSQLYDKLEQQNRGHAGLEQIFTNGFREFTRLQAQSRANPKAVMDGTTRAMRVAQSREIDKLENHLSFLATVGSTSPYVGLFGTVWGIMTSFQALGSVQQATIAMVAPGISEALIATAMGLFAAIPAVIAYNRFNNTATRLANDYDTFQDEFSSILHRQAHAEA